MTEPTKNALACRKWKAKNIERELERQRNRIYSPEEREYRRVYNAKYLEENYDKLKTYRKAYYEENKDKLNNLPKEISLFKNAQNRARKKNLPFDITLSDVVIPEFCPVFRHIKLCTTNTMTKDNSPSIDRVIPELGYVKGNVIVTSHRANTIKSYGTADEHRAVAKYIDQAAYLSISSNE